MGLEQRMGTFYRRANESFGRQGIAWTFFQLGFPLVGMGGVVAFLATTVDWYWHALGWLGVLYAILLSWILLGAGIITYRDLFQPSWLPRSTRVAPRSILENRISIPELRRDIDQTIMVLRNDFSTLRNEMIPKVDAFEDAVIPVVRAHARMILLLTDRDRFSNAVAEFERLSQAIRNNFLGHDPAARHSNKWDLPLRQARIEIANVIKDDFGEYVDLWPDLKVGENPNITAPNDSVITDPARQREYRDFHRRYGVASRLVQEFKGKYNSEMERVTEIVSEYARGARSSKP